MTGSLNTDLSLTKSQQNWVEKIREYIRANAEKITLQQLSEETGISVYHLQRTFKKIMGFTPRKYQEACRIENLKNNLRRDYTVYDSVHEVGYGSTSWLYSKKKPLKLGMTPSEYREDGRGMMIRYRILDSPLDRLLVARTEHGVCYIGVWSDDNALENALRREYPAAELVREDTGQDLWTNRILEYIVGRVEQLGNIPLDVSGTDFQLSVWNSLRQIPKGSTVSYQEIAKAIGRPTASRAVGRAIGTNPVPLLIPCHRVIKKNGKLGGYAWGIERKKKLLRLEEVKVNEK